jgi:hypothetical protein
MKKTLLFNLILFVSSLSFAQQNSTASFAAPITTIEFEEATFNYGEITAGEKIQNVFQFTNTGDAPLIITSAKGSCGCTVPEWPKEPIMPGETAEMLVQFDSKGKKGNQSKRVSITANTDPAISYLTIKGTVIKAEEKKIVNRNEDFDIASASVVLYPNPTADLLNINLKEHSGKTLALEIYNLSGQLVSSQKIDEITEEDIQINVSNYELGIYTVSMKIADMNRIAKRFTIAR